MNTLIFLYHNKLRIVKPLTIKQGRFGALLTAETRTGKIKSFQMNHIVALTPTQQAVLDGEVAINS